MQTDFDKDARHARRIALTGGIASGKSLAADYLRQKGVPVIDADDVVHQLLREDNALKSQIREAFGDDVFTPEGMVDRKKLAAAVFGDTEKRKLLESWVHPKTREVIEAFYRQNRERALGVSVIPLLFESGLEARYDEIWLMEADEAQQLARLTEKRAMAANDAIARMQSQMPYAEKRRRAENHPRHAIIRNNGTPEEVYHQLDALFERIQPAGF